MSSFHQKVVNTGDGKPSKRIIELDDDDLVDYEYQQPNIFMQVQLEEPHQDRDPPSIKTETLQKVEKAEKKQTIEKIQKKQKIQEEVKPIQSPRKLNALKNPPKVRKIQPIPSINDKRFQANSQSHLVLPKINTRNGFANKNVVDELPFQKRKQQSRMEVVDDEHVDNAGEEDNQVHGVSKKSTLTLWQSLNLTLGHYFYQYSFPIRREIPIIANNLDLQREKYENGTYISESFDNNLSVSFLLFFLKTVLFENFLRLSTILWIVAIILSFSIDNEEQYRPGREILLGVFIFYCVMCTILQYLGIKGRRSWTQPASNTKYKVYHYDNEHKSAEWIPTQITELRPGNIYKVPAPQLSKPSIIPTDSILLHANRAILQVDESKVIEYLSPMEKQERITLKQTLLKSNIILLPLTGVIHYELSAPQIVEENISGKFILQEPLESTHYISYNNILLRGTKILSEEILTVNDIMNSHQGLETQKLETQSQILAVVLETGIDSLVLKTPQYPYMYRADGKYLATMDMIQLILCLFYMIVVGVGILVGYIYLQNTTISRGYYIDNYLNSGERPILLNEIVLHHYGNLVMIIPILLRVIFLFYSNIVCKIIEKQHQVVVKDVSNLMDICECNTLVTTIGGDLIRMGDNKYEEQQRQELDQRDLSSNRTLKKEDQVINTGARSRKLQSIRVGSIHHNFKTTSIHNEYSEQSVDMINYFMSIGLLTCDFKNPTPLERGIVERCHQELGIKAERRKGNAIKIGQLKVTKIFTIHPTDRYPYKISFYQHSRDMVEDIVDKNVKMGETRERADKILCLIRGDTKQISNKMNQGDGGSTILGEFSSRMHQQKGYHIEILGKFVISYENFIEIRNVYMGVHEKGEEQVQEGMTNIDKLKSSLNVGRKFSILKFYESLDRYMVKIDPMGIFIWENPYSILSKSLSPISSLPFLQYKIIIAPASKSKTNPQFESIHTITNYLLKTSKLPLKEISNKILHNYEDKETFWKLLQQEKILVINGWDYRTIRKMLIQLQQSSNTHKKPLRTLSYIEQDEYCWILKQTNVSLATSGDGYDLEKYSDILISEKLSSSMTSAINKLFIFSQVYTYCINGIIVVQFMKGIMLACVEFVYLFYSWGTGLALIGSPLWLVLQIGILFDIAYYVFPKMQSSLPQPSKPDEGSQPKKAQAAPPPKFRLTLKYCIFEFFSTVALSCFLIFVCIYSTTEPYTPSGTVQPKQFTTVLIHFIIYHTLILRKLFIKPYNLSLYKIGILCLQIGIYYIGLVTISAVDYYQYKGAVWYVISGKIILVAIFMVWMMLVFYWVKFMLECILEPRAKPKNKYSKVFPEPVDDKAKVANEESKDNRIGEAIDIQ